MKERKETSKLQPIPHFPDRQNEKEEMRNRLSKRETSSRLVRLRWFELALLLGIVIGFFSDSATNLCGQSPAQHVIGRVVNDKKEPIDGASVIIASRDATTLVTQVISDSKGNFSIMRPADIRTPLFLYVSSDFESAGNEIAPILPPFAGLNRLDRHFLGQRFSDSRREVNLGDIPVQFWFGTVRVVLTRKGKSLTRADWKSLWYQLVNRQNSVLFGATPDRTEELEGVDLDSSEIRFSLPEGKWKIDFYEFTRIPGYRYSRTIASTGYFLVDHNSTSPLFRLDLVY